jgi:predicted nucleotidyltransferase
MSVLYLTNKEKEAIELLVSKLKAYLKDNLVQIQLFGSKARGDFNK